jgi:FkbM family methyltransferase
MKIHEWLGRYLFRIMPAYNATAFRFCLRYVDRFNGDNNSNPTENGEYRFLSRELSRHRAMTVFDVGANVGDWAAFALTANPQLDLHCFEPSEFSFSRLAGRQFPPNVRLNRFGLGECDETRALNIAGEGSGLNSLYVRQPLMAASRGITERITLTTADDYCARHSIASIDLIKIDVEGHELAVMRGMRRMLVEHRVKTIQFEYGGCSLDAGITLREIWNYLEPFGFRFSKLYAGGERPVAEYHRDLETFRYCNWVARWSGRPN